MIRYMAAFAAALSVLALALYLPAPAFADDLTANPEKLGFSAARLARIADWYRAHTAAGEPTGAVVALARGDDLAYLQAVGFQDRAHTIPMKTDSIFWMASMTKPVTSVAAMILVDEGKLELDAPVARYLPELKDMQVGVAETDPATGKVEIKRVPAERPMTVRDLLRHTSGLVYPPQYIDAPVNRLYRQAHFAGDNTLAEFVTSLAGLPLAHQPGTVWEYSWGVDVLGRVVEVASGQPFDQFLQSRIFAPLHMADTGFYVPAANLGRLVEAPEPRYSAFDVTKPRKLLAGGAGLVSTAADYLRFCQMLLDGGVLDGARILSAKAVQEMTTDSLPPGISFAMGFVGPKVGSSFGLGFAVRTDPASSNVPGSVGSFTWSGLWGTDFWVDPAEKLIAIQMIQVTPDQVHADFRGAIRNLTYGALLVPGQSSFTPPASPMDVPEGKLAVYEGKYDFGASSSAHDKMSSPYSRFVGTGLEIEVTDDGVKVNGVRDNEPGAKAGVKPGDLITEIDGAPVKGLKLDQVIDKMHGALDTQVRLKVSRPGADQPLEITVTRATVHRPPVALQVRVEAGTLVAEAIGTWPILDFEKGKPVTLAALSNDTFYADGGDHTRIAFTRDDAGKVTGAVLDPGPDEQKGGRY